MSRAQREVEHLLADGRAHNDFKQNLQCTYRAGLGRDALSLAADSRAAALLDAPRRGGANWRRGGAEGGSEAATCGVAV